MNPRNTGKEIKKKKDNKEHITDEVTSVDE
jgi:hypothetical protein